ncbi:hypothetical protein [Pseudomonas sp. R76]|uniref:hypothetical protein n=1 Tax=Pseudomonas sp. R76 TaxID=1573711 RepID=UPI0013201B5A|nr:hypothetical protein [Pseudomonas sp. R76]QHD05876.1 hypothetical protein PspR76_09030 [Pseudomonas sp. R76]
MLVIITLAIVVAGLCLWVVRFIANATVRTLTRVFIGLCLAAVIAYLVLAAGFPTSLLVQRLPFATPMLIMAASGMDAMS